MLKRLNIYFKEMYPIIPRLALGYVVFLEIYFILLLNNNVTSFSLGIQEVVGGITIFSFLLWLRVADDFKDYEHDCRLFPHRPLASGRVKKSDLRILLIVVISITVLLNAFFMNNFLFFMFLYTYGFFMAVWFFQKHKIRSSLPLALVTHNPVQLILNLYAISFTVIKYNLPVFSVFNVLVLFTLYFPALIWEISRKIRAPKDETEYVTYSKLFGYKKPVNFILILTWVDIATNILLVIRLSYFSVIALLINTIWITIKFFKFKQNPSAFKLVDKVERYTYIQEILMIITIPVYLLLR